MASHLKGHAGDNYERAVPNGTTMDWRWLQDSLLAYKYN